MSAKYALLALLCVSVSGCGAALSKAAAPGDDAAAAYSLKAATADGTTPGRGHRGGQDRGGMGMMGGKLAAQLNLTDDQKTRLKALMTANRPAEGTQPDQGARQAARAAFEAAWKADPVDAAGLKAAIDKQRAEATAGQGKRLDVWVAAREILTADQREKIATLLEAQAAKAAQRQPGQQARGDKPEGHDAKLNDAEKAKLQAFRAGHKGAHKPGDQLRALAAFARSGDRAALTAAWPAPVSADELVAFAQSLSATERADMLRAAERLAGFGGHGPWRGGHGRMGGHWGQHGHKGQNSPTV